MPTGPATPATARTLLAALADFGPSAQGSELVLATDPPGPLEPALRVLHTGVRAALTGRRWWGCDGRTGHIRALDPAAPIPAGVTLLSVEGDPIWDRIPPATRLDLPRLFASDPPAGPSGRWTARGPSGNGGKVGQT
jgi:hypothetical protein